MRRFSLISPATLLLATLSPVERAHANIFACTEQGILDAIALGGGPHTLDCRRSTTVRTTGEIRILNDVILDGQGLATVDGGSANHRVLVVRRGSIAEVRNMTISGGVDATQRPAQGLATGGGGISDSGTLSLVNCIVSRNSTTHGRRGGGILNSGIPTLINSIVSELREALGVEVLPPVVPEEEMNQPEAA
jgi:hypothetical protein